MMVWSLVPMYVKKYIIYQQIITALLQNIHLHTKIIYTELTYLIITLCIIFQVRRSNTFLLSINKLLIISIIYEPNYYYHHSDKNVLIFLYFIRYPYLYMFFGHLFQTLKVPFVSNIQSIEGRYVSYKALILPKNVYTLVLKKPINLKSYNSIYLFHL